MIQSLCDHGYIVIPGLLTGITAMSTLSFWWIKRYIRDRDEAYQRITDKLDKALSNHDDCQKTLPEKYSTRADVALICGKIDKITEMIGQFHLVYRTKDEAQREWRLLETRLTSMESSIKSLADSNSERHREIWDKLNRVVDFFRTEAEKIEGRLSGAPNK
jgi:hypothetical protein